MTTSLLSVIEQQHKALKLAVTQNSHDMLMTGEELRKCEAALAAGKQALEQTQGEVVAYVKFKDGAVHFDTDDNIVISNTPGDCVDESIDWLPVFTHPAPAAPVVKADKADAQAVAWLHFDAGAERCGIFPWMLMVNQDHKLIAAKTKRIELHSPAATQPKGE